MAQTELEIVAGKTRGSIILYPDRMQVRLPGQVIPEEITRDQIAEKVEIVDSAMLRRSVIISAPKKKVYQLKAEDVLVLRDWIGPPTQKDLEVLLKRTWKWAVPIGILLALTSLPMEADAAAGIEALPFDLVGFLLGSSLICLGYLTKRFPSAKLVLVTALWFAALGIEPSYILFVDGISFGPIARIGISLWAISYWRKKYQKFAHLSQPGEPRWT